MPRLIPLSASLLTIFTPFGLAAVCTPTWTDVSLDNNWGTSSNWSTGCVPMSVGDTATFGVSPHTTVNLNVIANINSITFNGSNYTLNASAGDFLDFTVPGATFTNSLGSQTINAPIELSTTLTAFTPVTDFTIFNGLISGMGMLSLTGSGTSSATTYTITNVSNSYSGGTTLSDTSVALTSANNVFGTGLISVSTTSTLNLTNATSGIVIPNNINLAANAIFDVQLIHNGFQTFSGQITGAGTLQPDFFNGLLILSNSTNNFSGGINLKNEGSISVPGSSQLGTGTITMTDGALVTTASMTIANPIVQGTFTFFTESAGTTATLVGPITGNPALMQIGDVTSPPGNNNALLVFPGGGTLFIDGVNPGFGAPVVIFNGTLKIPSQTALGTSSSIKFGPRANQFAGLEFADSLTFSLPTFTISGTSAHLIADVGTTSTVTSAITGAGALVIPGPGKIILEPATTNNYSGGTQLTGGTLEILSDAVLGSGSLLFNGGNLELGATLASSRAAFFMGPGTITADAGVIGTFTGPFTGMGSLTLPGPGIISLMGSNSAYMGEIFINGGNLIISNVNNLGMGGLSFDNGSLEIMGAGINYSFPIALAGTGTIITDPGSVSSFDEQISGPGGLIKNGTGFLTLANSNTYTGNTDVTAGVLIVNGSLVSSTTTTVSPGATLAGFGSLGTADIFGTLIPGDGGIGTLSTGNLTFESGSTYSLSLMGAQTDLTDVTGNVFINSGATLTVCPTNPTLGSYTIIHASGTRTGEFGTFVNNCSRLMFDVLYFPSDVVLSFIGTVPFPDILPPGNLQNIAVCFETLIGNPSTDLADVLAVLDTLTTAEIIAAFNQFDPSLFNSINFAEEDVAESVRQVYTDHFFQRTPFCWEDSCLPWRVWTTTFGESVDQATRGESTASSGYRNAFVGQALALDYLVSPSLALTTGFAYNYSQINWIGAEAKAFINTYTASLLSAWRSDCFRGDAYFGVSYHAERAKREVFVSAQDMGLVTSINAIVEPATIDRSIRHSGSSLTYTGHLGGAYDLLALSSDCGEFYLYPFANFDYLYLDQDSYSENGGDSLDLTIHSKGSDLFRPEAGIGFSYLTQFQECLFSMDVALSYVGEYRFTGKRTLGSFSANTDCVFIVEGSLPQNSLLSPFVQIGFYTPCEDLSLHLNYRGSYSHHYNESQGSFEIRYAW